VAERVRVWPPPPAEVVYNIVPTSEEKTGASLLLEYWTFSPSLLFSVFSTAAVSEGSGI
jgi:hypothetical protein